MRPGERRFVTLGMDALGRILVVVHAEATGRIRIISARKASVGETSTISAKQKEVRLSRLEEKAAS